MPLEQIMRSVWAQRWQVGLLILLLYVAGAAFIMTWPRRYVAEAVVAPAETTGIAVSNLLTSPLNATGNAFIENRLAGHFAVYLDSLRSAEAAAMLARDAALMEYLSTLRGEGAMGRLRRLVGLRLAADLDDARAWLQRSVSVTPGIATVTLTLAVSHRDRVSALGILRRLHDMAEAKVRADVAGVARNRVAAIEARLAAERDVFLRNALYDLLAQQQRTLMVIAADEAVAARMVSGPVVGVRPALPNRPLLLSMLAVAAPLLVIAAAGCLALLRAARAQTLLRPEPELPLSALRRAGAD
jgi:hypothetical protein